MGVQGGVYLPYPPREAYIGRYTHLPTQGGIYREVYTLRYTPREAGWWVYTLRYTPREAGRPPFSLFWPLLGAWEASILTVIPVIPVIPGFLRVFSLLFPVIPGYS